MSVCANAALKHQVCLLPSPAIGTSQLSIPSTLNVLPEERANPALGTNCVWKGFQGSTPTSGSPLSAASLQKGVAIQEHFIYTAQPNWKS